MTKRLFNYQQEPRPFGMKARRLKTVTRILLAIFAMMLFPQGTWAVELYYYRYDGTEFVEDKVTVPSTNELLGSIEMTDLTLNTGTYFVSGSSVIYRGSILISGQVDIVLCDGATLNAQGGIGVDIGATLNIYGQEKGTGQLNAFGYNRNLGGTDYYMGAAIGGYSRQNSNGFTNYKCGTIVIHGGIITADSNSSGTADDAAGIGGYVSDGPLSLTIYGGKVIAKGGSHGAGIGGGRSGDGGNVYIYGGEVIATGGAGDRTYGLAMGIGAGSVGSVAARPGNGLLTLGSAVTCYDNSNPSSLTKISPDNQGVYSRYQNMKTDYAYGLNVAGTTVTASNASDILSSGSPATASFCPTTNTLTLNNAALTDGIMTKMSDLKIQIKGNCSITSNLYNCIISTDNSGTLTFTKEIGGKLVLNSPKQWSVIRGFKALAGVPLETKEPYEMFTGSGSDNYPRVKKLLVNSSDSAGVEYAVVSADTTYPIWVEGQQVTSDNCNSVVNGVSYTPNDQSLKLDGVDLMATALSSSGYGILTGLGSLTVNLADHSSITCNNATDYPFLGYGNASSVTFSTDTSSPKTLVLKTQTNDNAKLFANLTPDYNNLFYLVNDGYDGSAYYVSRIVPATDLSDPALNLFIGSKIYDGQQITIPTIIMSSGRQYITLEADKDYTIKGYYKKLDKTDQGGAPKNADDYYVTIEGIDKYTGTANVDFIIEKLEATLEWTDLSFTYDSDSHKPTASVSNLRGNDVCTVTVTGEKTNASTTPYTATATALSNNNYKLPSVVTQTFTISRAAATISFASDPVNKTFGDTAFTNTLENKGDGPITGYNSSNTAVATVDANGKVTIVGSGDATITATVADGTNYTYSTKTASYQLKVGTAALSGVSATGYTGTYDAKAHGISVTAPAGATVKYGESAGTYNLTASPTYTNAGTYTVYYQVTKPNFTAVTGSQAVTISKAAVTISFASDPVNKTFGDAAFTNTLENKGDGKVTYSSSNTAVATVDANGKVTIVGSGDATITATVADGTNYTYSTKTASYQLKVGTAALSGVSATGYTGTYDAKAHGISVTAPAGATVKYGESAGTYNLTASPTYTNAGTYTVYYQVTKPNFTAVTGSKTVTITKANAQVLYVDYVFTTKIGETFNPPYLTLNPANLAVTYSSSDDEIATVDTQTGEVTLVSPGEVKIYAYFAGDANYNSAYDYYILTVLQRDIEPIDEDVVYMMDDEHFLYTDEDGHTKEVKLDNTIIYDILFTLNIDGDPSESDGYDETEHCIVLNHHMYDSRLYNLIFMGVEPGSKEYAEEYTGLTFKVPAGTGYVIIDSRTDGEHWMKVQIGDLAPVAFCHTDREKDYILYECEKDTWVHVYNGGLVSDVSMAPFHRAKKVKGQVRIYSITRSTSKSTGIERVNSDALESEKWYDLQGNRIQRPTRKGLYILDGQKVIVR